MKQRLTDDAEYVLDDAVRISSIRWFVDLPQGRFGSEAHAERYQAELSCLRRWLNYIYERNPVTRAMPGKWSKVTNIYVRDAFLTALDDDDSRRQRMIAGSATREGGQLFSIWPCKRKCHC
jgi:hypothetical protein